MAPPSIADAALRTNEAASASTLTSVGTKISRPPASLICPGRFLTHVLVAGTDHDGGALGGDASDDRPSDPVLPPATTTARNSK